jgi:hypothetical protein
MLMLASHVGLHRGARIRFSPCGPRRWPFAEWPDSGRSRRTDAWQEPAPSLPTRSNIVLVPLLVRLFCGVPKLSGFPITTERRSGPSRGASYQTTQQVIYAILAPCLIRLVLLRCANPLATRLRNFLRKPPSKWRTMPSVRSSMPSKAAFARWVIGNGGVLVRRLPAFEAGTPMRRGPGRGRRCGQRKTDVTRRSPSFR